MATVQKIVPCLWFDGRAEEAVAYYSSIFDDCRVLHTARYGKEGREIHGHAEGTVMTIQFELAGQRFLGLNGGPMFKFTEAVSFIVNCDNQAELDHYWDKLTDGGDPKAQQCGWLKDKFGVSWQIVPAGLAQLMTDPDPEKSRRVMAALLKMKKLDIAALERARTAS